MSTNSNIEWTDATWNPVTGCTRVSAGCDHCYAVGMTHRLENMGQAEKYGGLTVLNGKGDRHFNGQVRTHEDALQIPLKRRKPTRYFVNSMSDLFHRDVPFEFIDRVFAVMALTPQHTYQILTKRPERMADYFDKHATRAKWGYAAFAWTKKQTVYDEGREGVPRHAYDCDPGVSNCACPIPNVWLGTSVENQAVADERIPHLLRCPAAVRFLSVEPLLGPINLTDSWYASFAPAATPGSGWKGEDVGGKCPGVGWVIVGGESGGGARPCNIEWLRDIVKQCKAAGVPCFVKQLGKNPTRDGAYRQNAAHQGGGVCREQTAIRLCDSKGGDMAEWPEDLRVREFSKAVQP